MPYVRLKQWRKEGNKASLIDLRKAYLQLHISSSLWKYQAVNWNGKTYLLTRLGFGLATAPRIMTSVVEKIISLNNNFVDKVSSYIDDIFVNSDSLDPACVKRHFEEYGLRCKEIQPIGDNEPVRVLGLKVNPDLTWSRDGDFPQPDVLCVSRREAHSLIGEWVGHFPVAGWLRVVGSYVQRLTANEGIGWDEPVGREVQTVIEKTAELVKREGDPVGGYWTVTNDSKINVWTDASCTALGVVLETNGNVIEDASWLRRESDSNHINISELDAAKA